MASGELGRMIRNALASVGGRRAGSPPAGRGRPMASGSDSGARDDDSMRGREDMLQRREESVTAREAKLRIEEGAASRGDTAERSDELRQANESLVIAALNSQSSAEASDHANRLKEDFLAMLAHELRNPLAPIRNAVAILSRKTNGDPDLDWIHKVIDRQVQHIARMLDDMLDVARVNQGKVVLRKRPITVGEIVEQAVESCRPLINERDQHLALHVPEQPIHIDGDLVRLVQVFSNLLNNAAKYTQPGGDITLSAEPHGDRVALRVVDNGIGIEPAAQARVFDLFNQENRSPTQAASGLGIGLTVARRLIELHGGSIECHSEGLAKGSRFLVILPVLRDFVPELAAVEPVPPASQRSYRIAVIEDNVDASDTLAMLLRMEGHEVTAAFDGTSGVVLVLSNRPQIVLCDIGLPGMDGYAVVARLHEQLREEMPVMIALTGYGHAEDRRHALAAGFAYQLTKPVDIGELLAVFAQADERISGSP